MARHGGGTRAHAHWILIIHWLYFKIYIYIETGCQNPRVRPGTYAPPVEQSGAKMFASSVCIIQCACARVPPPCLAMDLKYAEVFPARSVYVFRPDKHNIRDRFVQVDSKLVKNWSSKGSTTLQIGSKAVAWSAQTPELSPKRFQAIRGPDFGPHLGCHLGSRWKLN